MFRKPNIKIEYALIGDLGSSKSLLVKHHITGTMPKHDDTIVGVEYEHKDYFHQNELFKISFWNLAESHRHILFIKPYVSKSKAIILFVEMEKSSVTTLQQLLEPYLQGSIKDNTQIKAIIGCYHSKKSQKLSHDDLIQFAQNNNIDPSLCFEVQVGNKKETDNAFNAIHEYVFATYKPLLDDLNKPTLSNLCRSM